jgi:hypothetical protein
VDGVAVECRVSPARASILAAFEAADSLTAQELAAKVWHGWLCGLCGCVC